MYVCHIWKIKSLGKYKSPNPTWFRAQPLKRIPLSQHQCNWTVLFWTSECLWFVTFCQPVFCHNNSVCSRMSMIIIPGDQNIYLSSDFIHNGKMIVVPSIQRFKVKHTQHSSTGMAVSASFLNGSIYVIFLQLISYIYIFFTVFQPPKL